MAVNSSMPGQGLGLGLATWAQQPGRASQAFLGIWASMALQMQANFLLYPERNSLSWHMQGCVCFCSALHRLLLPCRMSIQG